MHTISVIVDRLVIKEGVERRLSDAIESAIKLAEGLVIAVSILYPSIIKSIFPFLPHAPFIISATDFIILTYIA